MNSVPTLVCKIPGPPDWTVWLDGVEAGAMVVIAFVLIILATKG